MEEVMTTPAEVAARDKVTKQAVTKLVRRLVAEHQLPVERDNRGRIVRFSLAHFDHVRGQFASSEKTASARQESADHRDEQSASSTSRDEALRRDAWLRVRREELRYQEELSQLVRIDKLRDALTVNGREIQSVVARLQNRADDMALAVSREGVHGLRVLLRQISFDINTEIADKLANVASAAPEHDETLEGENV